MYICLHVHVCTSVYMYLFGIKQRYTQKRIRKESTIFYISVIMIISLIATAHQNKIPKAYISTALSYCPPNSSGAMCIGVPTIVQVIMASGLQNPRSVRVPLLLPSSCWNNVPINKLHFVVRGVHQSIVTTINGQGNLVSERWSLQNA